MEVFSHIQSINLEAFLSSSLDRGQVYIEPKHLIKEKPVFYSRDAVGLIPCSGYAVSVRIALQNLEKKRYLRSYEEHKVNLRSIILHLASEGLHLSCPPSVAEPVINKVLRLYKDDLELIQAVLECSVPEPKNGSYLRRSAVDVAKEHSPSAVALVANWEGV